MRHFRGLMTTPMLKPDMARDGNIHKLFPAPVDMRTKTSCPCNAAVVASSCPGRYRYCEGHSAVSELLGIAQGIPHTHLWKLGSLLQYKTECTQQTFLAMLGPRFEFKIWRGKSRDIKCFVL